MKKRLPIVKKRSGNDPISITNYFGKTKAKIEIRGFREDWQELWEYWENLRENDEEAFAKLGVAFLTSFMSPVSEVMDPNWLKDNRRIFLDSVKYLAAFYYEFFKYCFKVLSDNLPISIRTIARERPVKDWANMGNPTIYAAYCLEVNLGKMLSTHGLKSFFDLEETSDAQDLQSFYISYVQEGRNMIKKLSPEEVIVFWCNVLVLLMETTNSISKKSDKKELEDMRYSSYYSRYFLFDMLCAFLLHENDYIRQDIKEREEVLQIHGVLLQLYPFLKDTGSILEEIKKDDIQSWFFFEDYMTYHDRPHN